MRRLLARWDASPAEQAGLSFEEVLTLVNLRRVEIACLLGIATRLIELWTGFQPALKYVEIPMMLLFVVASLFLRDRRPDAVGRGFVVLVLVGGLFTSQWSVAALAAQGRLTSGYPTMLLSLTLLFVAPPRRVAPFLIALFVSYALIVLRMNAPASVKLVAIVNTGIVSIISIIATALIHASRRRDYEQKREIRLQNRRLVERNDELDSLMAFTAHDLRSPLYGLRNLIDLAVRRSQHEPDLPLKVLRQAIPSLDAMLAMATRLLDAHAAEHEPLKPLIDQDVRVHVSAAAERIAPLAQSLGVRIDIDLPDQPLIAPLDANAVGQILDNLLSNAVGFSPAKGAVSLTAEADASHVAVRVRDFGPGIDASQRGALFKRFRPGAAGGAAGVGGKGMGLFIVSTLAGRMGATVAYERPLGAGAAFLVKFRADR